VGATALVKEGLAGPVKPGGERLWMLRDEKPVAVDVVAGLDDDNFTEILQGDVKEGDVILLGEEGSAVR